MATDGTGEGRGKFGRVLEKIGSFAATVGKSGPKKKPVRILIEGGLALAIFGYPFGILAIIGLIGSIGVSINAALIILSALQEDPAASTGDTDAMVGVVEACTGSVPASTAANRATTATTAVRQRRILVMCPLLRFKRGQGVPTGKTAMGSAVLAPTVTFSSLRVSTVAAGTTTSM